jgi:hypothetical protein
MCRICAGVDRSGATDIKGKHGGSLGSCGILTPNFIQPNQPTQPTQPSHPNNSIHRSRKQTGNFFDLTENSDFKMGFRCVASESWMIKSISDFVSCNLYNIYVKSSDEIK